MEFLRPRGKGVLFLLDSLAICFICSTAKAKILTSPPSQRQSATVIHPQEDMAKTHYAQAERRIRIAVFTFNILNLGAAGYDAIISNLFMTLLDQHQTLEVMSRKEFGRQLATCWDSAE